METEATQKVVTSTADEANIMVAANCGTDVVEFTLSVSDWDITVEMSAAQADMLSEMFSSHSRLAKPRF